MVLFILPRIEHYQLTTAKRHEGDQVQISQHLARLQHIPHLISETVLSITLPPIFHRAIFGATTKVPSEKHRCQWRGQGRWCHPPWQLTLNCPLGRAPRAGATRCEWFTMLDADPCNTAWCQTGHGDPLTCSGSHGYHSSLFATTRINSSCSEEV